MCANTLLYVSTHGAMKAQSLHVLTNAGYFVILLIAATLMRVGGAIFFLFGYAFF
jgi:hypothetical protein